MAESSSSSAPSPFTKEKPLRIILMGQSAFAEKCLEAVLNFQKENDNVQVVAVYTNPSAEGKPEEPVKTLATSHQIPVMTHKSLKSNIDAVTQEWRDLQPTVALLCYVTQFIPESLFSLCEMGGVCYHPSLLPKYRGGSAIPWQLIQGEREGGVTWFWLVEAQGSKVDDGPICLQEAVAIGDTDTAASLYFNKLFPVGVKSCVEVVKLCLTGHPPRLEQDESLATWQPLCNDKVARVNWSQDAATVYNFVRGCDPQPGAFSSLSSDSSSSPIRFFTPSLPSSSSSSSSPSPPTPGQVVSVGGGVVTVACGGGGLISFGKLKGAGAKVSANDFVAASGLKVGDIFA